LCTSASWTWVLRELRSTRLDQLQDLFQGRRAAVLVSFASSGAVFVMVAVVVIGLVVVTTGAAVMAVIVLLTAVARVVPGGTAPDLVVVMTARRARDRSGLAVVMT
jgi:hypothetical protein